MTRPAIDPSWATDPSYTHGPVVGQPNKSQPSAGEAAEGFIPTEPIPADYCNWILNNHGSWISYLGAAIDTLQLGGGGDGPLNFDGSATVLGLVPAAGVYTLTRDIRATNITITGTAVIKPNGFRIFYTGTLDDTGSALGAGAPTFVNDGQAAGIGPPAQSITPGLTGHVGTVRSGFAGGSGAVNLVGGSPGADGTSDSDSIGGSGGNGGGSTGGQAGGNPGVIQLTAIHGPVAFTIWQLAGLIGSAAGLIGLGGGGGGGGGGTDIGTNGGGGGGAGGGLIVLIGKTLKLRAAASLRAYGGNGVSPSGGSGNGGGGGGGGGGALFLAYVEKIGGIVFTAAQNCEHGLPGANAGAGAPATPGQRGNIYEFVITGGSPLSPTEQQGIAAFASGGSGVGFDYQDVTLSTAFAAPGDYEITLAVGLDDDVSGAPTVSYRLKLAGSFRIRTNAQFDGEVSWSVKPV